MDASRVLLEDGSSIAYDTLVLANDFPSDARAAKTLRRWVEAGGGLRTLTVGGVDVVAGYPPDVLVDLETWYFTEFERSRSSLASRFWRGLDCCRFCRCFDLRALRRAVLLGPDRAKTRRLRAETRQRHQPC